MPIGFNIKKLREESNLSQNKLADELGITQSELSKIENNRSKKIDIHFMIKVCRFFNKNLDFFITKDRLRGANESYNIDMSLSVILNELQIIIKEYKKK